MAAGVQLQAEVPLALSAVQTRIVSAPVVLAPTTSLLSVRVPRSITRQLLSWGKPDRMAVSIVIEIDGVQYRCTFEVSGGVAINKGAEVAAFEGTWELPVGYFGAAPVGPDGWAALRPQRIGELAKSQYRAWVEVDRLAGSCQTAITLYGITEAAPANWPQYHRSIAYVENTSVTETAGDGVISVSYTASAGTDRMAVVGGYANGNANYGNEAAPAITYGGAAPTLVSGIDIIDSPNAWGRCIGPLFKDSEIGSGAKTVQLSASTSGGTPAPNTALGLMLFTGVHQTTPAGGAVEQASDGSANFSATATGVGATDVVADLWGFWAGSTAVGADQTQRLNVGGGAGVGIAMSTQLGSAGGAMTWTRTGGAEHSGGAFALKEAAAAGADPELLLIDGGKLLHGGMLRRSGLVRQ